MDTSGLNINAVPTPIKGMTAWALKGTAVPSQADMGDAAFSPAAAFVRLGLRTSDGAPELAESPAGLIDLYETGYKINPGTGTVEVTQTFAQFDDTFRAAVRGVAVSSGVQDIDVDQVVEGVLWNEDLYRMADGSYRIKRICAPAKIASIKTAKNQRGQITGTAVTWLIDRSDDLTNKHYREAWITDTAAPLPLILSIGPAGVAVAGTVLISGQFFSMPGVTLSGVTIDGVAVVSPQLVTSTQIIAKIPAGAVAASDVIVTTTNGASPAVSYTVD